MIKLSFCVCVSLCAANILIVLFIFADLKEALVTEVQEGDLFFSVTSYVAENEDAINLVEGERVYVLGEYRLLNATGVHYQETSCRMFNGCVGGQVGVDWVHLGHDMEKWRAVVNMVNLHIIIGALYLEKEGKNSLHTGFT